jgi:integrase-like protein
MFLLSGLSVLPSATLTAISGTRQDRLNIGIFCPILRPEQSLLLEILQARQKCKTQQMAECEADLRHSIATILLDSGLVPIDQVQKFLGHTLLSTTQIYAQTSLRALGENYIQALGGKLTPAKE